MATSVQVDRPDYLARGLAAADPANLRLSNSLTLFSLGILWGLQFALLKVATNAQLGEFGILAVSMSVLALSCLAMLACQNAGFRPTLCHLRFFFLSGLFGFVVPLGGIILAANFLSAGLIVLIESLTPIFTVAIALSFRTERVTRQRLAAVALGVIGVMVVGAQHVVSTENRDLTGLMIALVIPLSCAIDGVYVAKCWPTDLRTTQVVTGEAVAGASIALPLFLWSGESSRLFDTWTEGHWALAVFTLVSLVETLLYFCLLKKAGALYVSIASFLALFAGIGWGMLLLDETHAPGIWLAIGLVCMALYLIVVKESSSKVPRLASQ